MKTKPTVTTTSWGTRNGEVNYVNLSNGEQVWTNRYDREVWFAGTKDEKITAKGATHSEAVNNLLAKL